MSLRVQVGVVMLLVVALSAKIWMKHECTDLGYQLAEERQETVSLDLKRRELELELSVLKRREVIEKEALAKLGMRQPHPQQIVVISKE